MARPRDGDGDGILNESANRKAGNRSRRLTAGAADVLRSASPQALRAAAGRWRTRIKGMVDQSKRDPNYFKGKTGARFRGEMRQLARQVVLADRLADRAEGKRRKAGSGHAGRAINGAIMSGGSAV